MQKRVVSVLGRAYRALYSVELLVAGTLLCVTVLMLLALAVGRLVGHPFSGLLTLSLGLLTWAVFVGADVALRDEKVVAVDLVISRVPGRAKAILQGLIYVMIIVFLVVMVRSGIVLADLTSGRMLPGTGIDYAYIAAAVPVGCSLMIITMIGHVVRLVREGRIYGTEPDEGQASV